MEQGDALRERGRDENGKWKNENFKSAQKPTRKVDDTAKS